MTADPERGRGAVAGPVRRRRGVRRLQSVRAGVPGAGVHHDEGGAFRQAPRDVERPCPEGDGLRARRAGDDGARARSSDRGSPGQAARSPRRPRARRGRCPGYEASFTTIASARSHVPTPITLPALSTARSKMSPCSASPIGSTDHSTAPDGESFATAPGGLMEHVASAVEGDGRDAPGVGEQAEARRIDAPQRRARGR